MEGVSFIKKFLLSCSHLLILVVDHVKNISPGSFLRVDTLGFAVAEASVDLGKIGGLYRFREFFGRCFSGDVDQLSRLSENRNHLGIEEVLEKHGCIHNHT